MGRLDDPALGQTLGMQGAGLSPFVAKIVVAEVEVGDGRDGLQGCGNGLAKTQHDLATVQFGACLDEEMPI